MTHEELNTAIGCVLDSGGTRALARLNITPDVLDEYLAIVPAPGSKLIVGMPDHMDAKPLCALLALLGQTLVEVETIRCERASQH